MTAYTRQKAKSKYMNRVRLERASQKQLNRTIKTRYHRVKQWLERKRMNAVELISDRASTYAAGAVEIMQVDDAIDFILTLFSADINCV
ncbi:hypothetical protein TNCV_1931791 [Trichonephila clavipes]|nr:hypothetical protein TNCV_1931791 [Trichonephila clavipes]